jgi:hypothetical protein
MAVFLLMGVACGESDEGGTARQLVPPAEPARLYPVEFIAGSYEIVGRRPDSAVTYAGRMEIVIEEGAALLSITRTIGETVSGGTGSLEKTSADGVEVLRIHFEENGITYEATYLLGGDLDNYARLSGYVYKKAGGTQVPGIEALFSDHFSDEGE